MRQIDQAECEALALKVLAVLDGISIAQARWVMRETETILAITHPVDSAASEREWRSPVPLSR